MRRAKGSGAIRKRGDSWQIRYLAPPDSDGKRKNISETVKGLRKEAERVLRLRTGAIESGSYVEKTSETAEQFFNEWLKTYAAHNTSPRTQQDYAGHIKRYVTPEIGQIPLQSLRPQHIQSMENSIFEKGLSGTTALHVHRIVKQSLEHAVQWEKLVRNPAASIKAPRPTKRRVSMWDLKTISRFKAVSMTSTYNQIFETALITGMRRSELLGLKWSAIDLETGKLKVLNTLQRITGKGLVEGIPKTDKSRRSIKLGQDIVKIFRKIQTAQVEARLAAGSLWQQTDFVFTKPDGAPIDPDSVTHEFTRIIRENELPKLNFHGLRHAHATLLLTSGIHPKVVSERLGHSNIGITLDTYSHVLPSLQEEAADAIERQLAKAI